MGLRVSLIGLEKRKSFSLTKIFFRILLYSVLHPYLFLCRDCPAFCLFIFTCNTLHKHPCPRAEFEPAISTSARPQTLALDRSAIGIGKIRNSDCRHALYAIPRPSHKTCFFSLIFIPLIKNFGTFSESDTATFKKLHYSRPVLYSLDLYSPCGPSWPVRGRTLPLPFYLTDVQLPNSRPVQCQILGASFKSLFPNRYL
jgi:hypothetical protein